MLSSLFQALSELQRIAKTAREKMKKEKKNAARRFFIFSRAVFRAAPQLTKRLEEVKC